MFPRLPYATTSDEGALIVDNEHRPVWPAASSSDASVLEDVAQVFGTTVAATTTVRHAADCRVDSPAGGFVAGLGDVETETRLYAHLTRRPHRMVDTAAALANTEIPEVVVTCAPTLDSTLVRLLLSAATTPVGIIWGRTRDELRRIALARSAASVLNGPTGQRRVDIVSDADLSEDTVAGVKLLGSKASRVATRDALSAGAGVLTLDAHGSGPRIIMKTGMPLCAMSAHIRDSLPRDLAPACATTGYCFAAKAPVAEALEQQIIIDPNLLRARVLILGSCQALYVGSRGLEQRWGYFPHLNGNWQLGAILATPDLVLNMAISEDLTAPIAAGMGVGNALRDYNTSPTALEIGQRLLLLGDPRTRAAPRNNAAFVARPTSSRQRAVKQAAPAVTQTVPRGSTEGHLEVLRHISETVRHDTRETGSRTSVRAAHALSSYEDASNSPSVSTQNALWHAILDHLGTLKGRPYEGWFPRSSGVKMLESGHPCPCCGWPALLYHCTMPSGDTRVMVNCARCGNVLDVPKHSRLRIHTESTTLRLSGLPVGLRWAAATYLVPEEASNTHTHHWLEPGNRGPIELRLPSLEGIHGPVMSRTVVISTTALCCIATGELVRKSLPA